VRQSRCLSLVRLAAWGIISTFVAQSPALAQSVNYEGQTGAMVTPSAYVADSPAAGIGRPIVSFHLLSGGPAVGTRFQISLLAGVAQRVEIGFTRSAVASAEDEDLGRLFDRGFSNIHAKVNVLAERRVPAISAGVIVRWQRQHLEDGLGVATQNADVYVVATKTARVSDDVSLRAGGGLKFSNASRLGLAGNAPDWTPLGFAAASALVAGLVEVGAEILQQPAEIDGFPAHDVPATLSVFVRLTPLGRRLAIDAAFVRLAGEIAPGVDARAESRFLVGASFRF
jgi:hypothetical protein